MIDKIEETKCYSYKVEMIIQVLAEDEESARSQLDKNGGYVTSREVTLMDSVSLYNGDKNQSTRITIPLVHIDTIPLVKK